MKHSKVLLFVPALLLSVIVLPAYCSHPAVPPIVPLLKPGPAAPLPLHVAGTLLKNSRGQTVRLRGVNIPSLEWSNTGDHVLQSVSVAIGEWHSNAIRLPLSQDRWFGRAEGQTDGGAAYQQTVDTVVNAISARKAYVIVDLHWSDAGVWGKTIAQHKMPDPNSLLFWKDLARRYGNHPAVLFDLYNEPRDVTWEVWKDGGAVTETDKKTRAEISYTTPGMQKLINALRDLGANNVVVVGGLDWAYDLSGLQKGFKLSDPGGAGIVYDTHIYPWKGTSPDNWDPHVAIPAQDVPVIVGEVGCEPDPKQEDPNTWAPKILDYINRHGWSWTAWCFHTSASPRLLANWNYTPTPYWGAYVKKALE